MPEQASRMMLLRQGPMRPSKVLLENGGLGGEDDATKGGGVHEKAKKALSERSPTFVRRPRSDLSAGVRVVVKGAKVGTIRYVGEIRFATGLWCGVELDEPAGRHNGEKYGVRYFHCRNNHGIYVPAYKVFPLGRLIEEVSLCSASLDEPWSLDTDCASLTSRKSGRFEEFLHETRLSEVDIWRMLTSQQHQLTENYNPDSSFTMALNKFPLRSGLNLRTKGERPTSPHGPDSLSNSTVRHNRTVVTRATGLQNSSNKSDPSSLQTSQVSTSKSRGPERKVLGPSNPSLDAKKVVIATDLAKKSDKLVTSLQQPRSKPMASRASLLRESFTRIKDTMPRQQLVTGNGGTVGGTSVHTSSKSKGPLVGERKNIKQPSRNNAKRDATPAEQLIWTQQPKDGRASYKVKGNNSRRQERTLSQENIARINHINLTTSQNHIRSTASQSNFLDSTLGLVDKRHLTRYRDASDVSRHLARDGYVMTSWRKKIKLRFGRHSGDVSPPTTLIDDLPPPFARSMSLRYPGYTTRDGDLRPDSILLLDDQRIPTLQRTWSFRQAVTHKNRAAPSSSSSADPADSYQKPVIFHGNYTGAGTVPECPPSPTKPAFFSRLFRFSLRDRQKSKGVLPPSVAHVDVIRTGDPERRPECGGRDGISCHGGAGGGGGDCISVYGGGGDGTSGGGGGGVGGGGGFSAADQQQLSQWPSVQSDIVAMNDGISTSFISQWASVPTDMTSALPVVKGQPQPLPVSSEWSSVDNEIEDEDDKDVVVIRRCTTLPSFRIRSRSDISCPSSRVGLEQDSVESNSSLPLLLREGQLGRHHHHHHQQQQQQQQHAVPGSQHVDHHGARKKGRRTSREVLQDELRHVLLNGTYPPPKVDEIKPLKANGLVVHNPSNVPVQVIDSPCSDDSAVGDLSPVNHLLGAAEAQDKFTVNSTIFETSGIKASTSTTLNNTDNYSNGAMNGNSVCSNIKFPGLRKVPLGPTIDLEDPKTTRRRFESRLPNSCRPASVSPVRDPAVIRRVKKNIVARPVSYTPGFALMQRASTDLTAPLPLPSTAERASSAEPLVSGHFEMSLAAENGPHVCQKRSEAARRFGSMQDVRSRPSTPVGRPNSRSGIPVRSESREIVSDDCQSHANIANLDEECADEERAVSRGSRLSNEVDSGTFVRKKPVPLQRSGTFTKEDSTTPVEELPVVETSVDDNTNDDVVVVGKVKDLQRDQPARKSLRRELRKPSEVAKVKELNITNNNNNNNTNGCKDIIVAKDEVGQRCGSGSSSITNCNKRKSKAKQIVPPMKLDLSSPTSPVVLKDAIAYRDSSHKSSKLPAPGSFVRGTTQNSSRRRIALPVERQTSIESAGRSGGSAAASPETPDESPKESNSTKELPPSPGTPKGHRSRIAAPSKIARAGRSKNSGLRLIAKSPPAESAGQQSPSVIEDADDLNRTFDIIATSQPPCLVESVSRVADEARQQIRSAMNEATANSAPVAASPPKDTALNPTTTTITLTATSTIAMPAATADADAAATTTPTNCAPTATSSTHGPHCNANGIDEKNATKATKAAEDASAPTPTTGESQDNLPATAAAKISPAKSDFENEILRLGETCEARSVELSALRSELRRSSVAFSAMALAAQYWSERLRRTEDYSQQLKGQLQMAEKVILKAHTDIENLKKDLQDEVSARKQDVQHFEQTKGHKLADLEQKHAAAVALLEKDFERRLEEALEKEREKSGGAGHEVVPLSQLQQLKVEHAQALQRLESSRAEEINALTDAQRELERRLAEKSNQCRRVEEEAVALKDKLLQSADSRAQWLTKKVASLEKEVESLNAVLEIKAGEVRELQLDRRENQDRKEKMASMQEVIDKHRARIEDLTAQLDRKTEVQQQLTAENVKLHELSAKKDRIITQLDHDFEELKYRARDSSSFVVDVSTPMHRPLRESKSLGGAATTPEADGIMSRSWHVSFGDGRSARRMSRGTSRKSSSSESKASDEETRVPTALDEVFSREEQIALEETVAGQVAVSRA